MNSARPSSGSVSAGSWKRSPGSAGSRGAYSALFTLILLDLLIGPTLLEAGHPGSPWMNLLVFTSVFVVLLFAYTQTVRLLFLLVFLPILLLDHWVLLQEPSPAIRLTSLFGNLLICVATQITVIMQLHHRPRATLDTLLGAICVYLLIGYDFYLVYDMVELVSPGSFRMQGQNLVSSDKVPHLLNRPQLLYFSFVTFTTLGYGDIAPTWSLPRSLVVIEALISQLFTAILFSVLVSSYVANSWSQVIPEEQPDRNRS